MEWDSTDMTSFRLRSRTRAVIVLLDAVEEFITVSRVAFEGRVNYKLIHPDMSVPKRMNVF